MEQKSTVKHNVECCNLMVNNEVNIDDAYFVESLTNGNTKS